MGYANVIPPVATDGVPYAVNKTLTSSEADVGNQTGAMAPPATLPYHRGILASVELSVAGAPASNSTYVVMQTDLGDNVWYDVAWCLWTGTTGSANFLLAGGAWSAGAFQQSRALGTAPASSGSNAVPIGTRVRFVGKAALTGGTSPAVTATVTYHPSGLR